MSSKFKPASQETHGQLNSLIEKHYSDISAIGVKFDILMAFGAENDAGEKTGPAIKQNGYPANASIAIIPLKWRVRGMPDAEIMLDGDRWDSVTEEEQLALLDHELHHIVIARNIQGETILDSHGRPKLKLKLHDRQFGWFDEIAKRHGSASAEVEQATQLVSEAGAIYFQSTMALGDDVKPKQKKLSAPKKK